MFPSNSYKTSGFSASASFALRPVTENSWRLFFEDAKSNLLVTNLKMT